MKYCSNCGAELTPGAKFCDQCGVAVGTVAETATPAPTPPTPEQPSAIKPLPAAPQQPRRIKWRLLLVAAAVVVLVVGGGWWYTHRLFNFKHTRFRQATTYAWQGGHDQVQLGGADPTMLKNDREYFQFLPDGKMYHLYIFKDKGKGQYYNFTVKAGSYRLTKHQLRIKMTGKIYYGADLSMAKLVTKKPHSFTRLGRKYRLRGTYQLGLSHGNMAKYTFVTEKGVHSNDTFKPHAKPVAVAKNGVDVRAIYRHLQKYSEQNGGDQ
ncbi:zinc ribbon domain-containing protein [Lacticaseibacillus nasuensis]|uniref:zinc ribbon domain-containing protein n=1 Tax=Lacticaseibacillus nasuensis TaxID=944671 RepID=UPI0006CF5C5B|nr:zinc ribbon domain-containing protein [Lacticaseibacillus nasuensis]